MPYIEKRYRKPLDRGATPATPGEFAYVLTRRALACLPKVPRFSDYATAMGEFAEALPEFRVKAYLGARVCAAMEFYRRLIAPYEDQKRKENGDVF